MNIGFIGAGKVGFSLGKYFCIKNLTLSGYYSRSLETSKEASKFTNSKYYDNLEDFINDSDLIFITTPDDYIYEIWQKIKIFNIKDKIICHASGSLSSKIFSDINNSGAYGYSIHPMFAFPDKYNSYLNLENAYFSIEGDQKYINKIKSFIESLGNNAFIINSEDKTLYHLANVMVSNLVLSIIDIGSDYLEVCGVNKTNSIKALLPLIQYNIEGLIGKGLTGALTGPVERADLGTIIHHIEVIPKEHLELYKILSLNLIKLSKYKHPERNYYTLESYLQNL